MPYRCKEYRQFFSVRKGTIIRDLGFNRRQHHRWWAWVELGGNVLALRPVRSTDPVTLTAPCTGGRSGSALPCTRTSTAATPTCRSAFPPGGEPQPGLYAHCQVHRVVPGGTQAGLEPQPPAPLLGRASVGNRRQHTTGNPDLHTRAGAVEGGAGFRSRGVGLPRWP